MMSHRSRQEQLDAVRARYAQAKRREKGVILDELIANSGYNRKYAITVLRHPREVPVRRKCYLTQTDTDLEQAHRKAGPVDNTL